MNFNDCCEAAIRLGGKEYPASKGEMVYRVFQFPAFADAPDCACNDKAPGLHVKIYADFSIPGDGRVISGSVETEVFGKAPNGHWIRASICSVPRAEFESSLPQLTHSASAVWSAFVYASPFVGALEEAK